MKGSDDLVNGDRDFNLEVSGEYWLFSNPQTSQCESLIVPNTATDIADYPFVFGAPLFREYIISMHYTSGNITVYDRDQFSPITPGLYPEVNTDAHIRMEMTAQADGTYSAKMYAGDIDK